MPNNKMKFIKEYGINMNKHCTDKLLIGRHDELRTMMQTLTRREKSSILLIGMAGTGKTSMIHGLCNLINQNKVPNSLRDYTIYSININKIESGTKFQGELEERIEGLLQEAKQFKHNTILFIDEIHVILSNKLANVIKPYISSGDIKCIGATTIDEYRKFVESDAALKRRFNLIYINEPNINDTINIVRGIKHQIQEYYTVKIPDKIIQTTAQMSKRYFTTLNNPDLTIELLDDTANRIKFEREIEPDSIAKIGNQILELNLELESLKLEDDKSQNINILKLRVEKLTKKYEIITSQWKRERDNIKIIMKLQKHVNDITEKIYHYKSVNNFVEAGRLLYLELPKYKQQLDQLEQQTKYEYINLEIQNKDILITISKKTGIGIEQLSHDAQSIFQLKNFLLQNIVGQDKAIHDICQQLKRVFGGFRNANRPLSVMCFTGPTGVGKTKMAELIGEFLFNNKDCVKIINMAQYQERHNTSGLFGTTAGYVGYKEEGILTGAVRIRPYQVILLDELEKAHPSIFDTLLAIFDKGIIEDNAGRITSFREAIIIITMNVYNLQTQINDDENHMYNSLIIEMKKKFNPEFIGRIDSIVLFNTIGQKHYDTIIRRQVIQEINSFHKNTGINIVIEEQVYDYFVKFHSKFTLGVRDINKTLQDNLYVKIIDVACDIPSNLKKSSTLVVQFCNGDIHVQLSNNTNLLQN